MAFTRCMGVVYLLVVVPSAHIAHGYSIPQCGSDGTLNVTGTQKITLTCTGITNNTMFWDLLSSNRYGQGIALCTWTPSSCRVTNSAWYEVSRTQYSTSTLTVTHTTRDSIAGLVRCGGGIDPSSIASCYIRVVSVTTTTTTTQTTTTTRTTARETPSNTALPPTSTTARDTRTTDQNTERNDDDDDDDDDGDGLPIPVIAVGAGGGLLVIIAVVIAIVVWKKRCDPTYVRPTRRSQLIYSNIYTGLEPPPHNSSDQAPEEDVYGDTTGYQPAGHGTVEYVNTATGTQAAEGTVYMNIYSSV